MTPDFFVLTTAFAAIGGAALIAAGLAWLRPELDVAPRRAGAEAALVSLIGVAAIIYAGRGGVEPVIFVAALAALSVIDLRGLVLPDIVTLPLIGFGLVFALLTGLWEASERLIGAGLGFAAFWALGEAWYRLRGVDALGRGDAKLFSGIGAFLGWRALPDVALIAALAGIAFGLWRKSRGGDDAAPFGPALALGAVVIWAFGPVLSG
ncbi:MAG: A24 family peptidase [Pseudomonadota bacterium]